MLPHYDTQNQTFPENITELFFGSLERFVQEEYSQMITPSVIGSYKFKTTDVASNARRVILQLFFEILQIHKGTTTVPSPFDI
jgi:hypothetical protein